MLATLPAPCHFRIADFSSSATRRAPSSLRSYSTIRRIATSVSVRSKSTGASVTANGSSNDVLPKVATSQELKESLYRVLEGTGQGIFGVTSSKRTEIASLVEELEEVNEISEPTKDLDKVDGTWRLLFSTVSILGARRTKLGLREAIRIGEMLQIIDADQSKATNIVEFKVAGLGVLRGSLTLEASYAVTSATRVDIKLEKSEIKPDQLRSLFQKNYDLLLSVFNPEGWLEITYLDDSFRIGRDDKGNLFVLERVLDEQ